VIQTNLAQCPDRPIIEEVETHDVVELVEYLRSNERNDMNITAVPLAKLLTDLGVVDVLRSWNEKIIHRS